MGLGLDLSLTSSGWASGEETGRFAPKTKGTLRLSDFRRTTTWLVSRFAPDVATIEGYSMGSQGKTFDIGEMGGVVKLTLADLIIPFVTVPPTTLKMFAAEMGNANKDTMLEYAIRMWGFEGHGNDEADAWLLLKMTECAYGKPLPKMTAAHQAKAKKALAGIEWPVVLSKNPPLT